MQEIYKNVSKQNNKTNIFDYKKLEQQNRYYTDKDPDNTRPGNSLIILVSISRPITRPDKPNAYDYKPAIYCMEAVEDNNYVGYCRNHFKRTSYTRLPLVQNNKCTCYYLDD